MTALILLVLASGLATVHSDCTNANWWASFDHGGLSTCTSRFEGIRGFYRNIRQYPDWIYLLEEAVCCTPDAPYRMTGVYKYADWWFSFDKGDVWVNCPDGFFLQGLWRSEGADFLYYIEYGRCWKPADHPHHYGECYEEDISISFDNSGTSQCRDGYFVTGLYRGQCSGLHCLDRLQCCKMAPNPDVLDSESAVKTLMMERTLYDLSYLAHNLGYGWCKGYVAEWVGEDFNKVGDSWEAVRKDGCSGVKCDHRLGIHYGHWSYHVSDIVYGAPVVTPLKEEVIYSAAAINRGMHGRSVDISRNEDVVRQVTHTPYTSWKDAHGLKIDIPYKPFHSYGDGDSQYIFNYKSDSTTKDASGKEQKKRLTATASKQLQGRGTEMFHVVLHKTRITVPYVATVVASFSVEFRGFLRMGNNHHYQFSSSTSRPTFNYRFGDAATPFYEALKQESATTEQPWKWGQLLRTCQINKLVDKLTSKEQYMFRLSGKFDEVQGSALNIKFSEVSPDRSGHVDTYTDSSVRLVNHVTVASEQDGDPGPVSPSVRPEKDIVLPRDVHLAPVKDADLS